MPNQEYTIKKRGNYYVAFDINDPKISYGRINIKTLRFEGDTRCRMFLHTYALTNKDKIKALVLDMLKYSHDNMLSKIDKVLKSGSIDTDAWDEKVNPMILPKCILAAILQHETLQYQGRGTSFEKKMKKEINNISYFI
jgi:hypothetical protein